jgi:tripartite-type tricarboxylate transporter receptor subunit TctC
VYIIIAHDFAIVVAAAKRSPLLPDVPTVKELGLGDINDSLRYIMVAPAKTSKPIMEHLSATLAKVLAEPSVNEAYGRMGYEVITRSLAEVSAMIPEQHEFWGPIIKDLNLKLE